MVPDRVARWFGAGAEGLGEENDSSKVVAVMHEGIHKAESATQQALVGGMKPKPSGGPEPKPELKSSGDQRPSEEGNI